MATVVAELETTGHLATDRESVILRFMAVGQVNLKVDHRGVQNLYTPVRDATKSAAGIRGCFDEQSVAESEF